MLLHTSRTVCRLIAGGQAKPGLRSAASIFPSSRLQGSTAFTSHDRCLHLASTNPVSISEDRRTVVLQLADGNILTQRIAPTPKISTTKLQRELALLLSSPDNGGHGFTTHSWDLDEEGDAIHRHFAFASTEALEDAIQLIMHAAKELNHDPHIARGQVEHVPNCVTLTCTTHQPRGLSGRDLKLAARINAILNSSQADQRTAADVTQSVDRITRERSRLVEVNRNAISQALESCACTEGKSNASP